MSLRMLLNWRQALVKTVLIVVMLSPNGSEGQAGLWIEQGRYPPVSYEMVRVKTERPGWLRRWKAWVAHWKESRKGWIRRCCQILALVLLVWLNMLGWLIEQIVNESKTPIPGAMEGSLMWHRPVGGATLEVEMTMSVKPTVTEKSVMVEKVACIEAKPLTTTSYSRPMIVLQEKEPLMSEGSDISKTKEELDEDKRAIKSQRNEQMASLSRVVEQKSHSKMTKASNQTSRSDEIIVEQAMISFYKTLNEKDRRRYAAVEAIRVGHGGQSLIAKTFGLSRKTIAKGIKEVKADLVVEKRIRKKGAGRKPYSHHHPTIDEKFLDVLTHYTAGEPMKGDIRWTNLTRQEIAQRLEEKHQIKVSVTVIKQLLEKHNFRRRKAQKRRTMKPVAFRNEQFEKIARLKEEYKAAGNPIISMDTKKKEHLGNYYRDGYLYTVEELATWDHDFLSMAYGVIIPHSFFDELKKKGHINIGTSKDTTEFACDSFKFWWNHYGKHDYPDATSLLLLCDGGGSNSSRYYIFKEDLQNLVNEIGLEIRVAHYPPYCSKYNPIEHRFFPHVTRACQGVVLETHQIAQELMQKTSTKTGITTTVDILDKTYETGRKCEPDFKENISILFDDHLGQWNYRAVPSA